MDNIPDALKGDTMELLAELLAEDIYGHCDRRDDPLLITLKRNIDIALARLFTSPLPDSGRRGASDVRVEMLASQPDNWTGQLFRTPLMDTLVCLVNDARRTFVEQRGKLKNLLAELDAGGGATSHGSDDDSDSPTEAEHL